MSESLQRWIAAKLGLGPKSDGRWVARSVADEYQERARVGGRREARVWLLGELARLS